MDPIVPHADCDAHRIPLAVLEESNTRTVIVDRHFALIVDRLLPSVRAVCWYPTLSEIHTFGPVTLLHLTPAALFRAWRREMRRHHGFAERIDAYGDDSPLAALAASLGPKPSASTWIDTRSAHAAVLAALELDPEAFALALRARPRPRPNALSSHDYARVWRHVHRYRQCAAEGPQLLRALHMGIMAGTVDVRRPAGQGLYEACLRARIGKGGWRRLMRWPARFLDAALELGRDEPAWAVAMAYLRFLDEAGIEEPPPGRLITALARCVVNTEREPFRFDADPPEYWPTQFLRLALQRGCRAWRTGDPDSFIDWEFLPVLLWVRDTDPRLTGYKQRHWAMYVKRARSWARAEQARLACLGKDWPVGSYPSEVMGFTAVALHNPCDLLTEGLAMRHCANRLAKACAQSGLRVFSLRDGKGRHVATAVLGVEHGRYVVDQVKGFANSPVSATVRTAAQRLADAYRPAPGHAPLGLVAPDGD